MNNTLYLECFTGISGDMSVAALIDLGVDIEVLKTALDSLPVDGYKIEVRRVKKSGIDACDFNVILDEEIDGHDHDMEYLYGQEHIHNYSHDHVHMSTHEHKHRCLGDIMDIIHQGTLTDGAKKIAIRIFEIMAVAEAKAHGNSIDEVHFHEVGAVDSIIDIVAFAVCFDQLNIDKVIVPVLNEGCGHVRCQHGFMPVPVPAVINIISKYELVLHQTDIQGELITPTGAAIVAAICNSKKLPEKMVYKKIGIGAGKRNYEKPSFVRAILL